MNRFPRLSTSRSPLSLWAPLLMWNRVSLTIVVVLPSSFCSLFYRRRRWWMLLMVSR